MPTKREIIEQMTSPKNTSSNFLRKSKLHSHITVPMSESDFSCQVLERKPAKHKPWVKHHPHRPRARSRTAQRVPWTEQCSDVRVFSFPDEVDLRECLSQDRRGRARTLPTRQDCEEPRRAANLPSSSSKGGRAEEPRLECSLDQKGDDRCINNAPSSNRWVICVESPNTTRPITPRRTHKRTHKHQRRENKRGRGARTRSVNTFCFPRWLNTPKGQQPAKHNYHHVRGHVPCKVYSG